MPILPTRLLALCVLSPLCAQATVIPVATNSAAAFEAAIVAANGLAFQTSAASPVVIEFAPSVIGQTIALTHALPTVAVDHFTLRVAGAAPAARVIVDATNAPTAFRIASHHASVHNVRFQNAGAPGSQEDVFTAFGTDDLLLANCDFDGATGNALWLIAATNTAVRDCGFRFSSGALIASGGGSGLVVERCTFATNQQGILLAVANAVTVRDCVFDGNGLAMTLQPVCAGVTFGPNNVVRNTTTLPALVAAGAVQLDIVGNQFLDNHHAGIQLRDLCATVAVRDNVLLRNGLQANVYQLLIDSCILVHIAGLQCRDGAAGVFATATTTMDIVGSTAAPTAIADNDREGVVLNACANATLDGISITGNLQTVGGSQLAILASRNVDVVATDVSTAPGPARVGVRIDASQTVRVGEGTTVLDNGGNGVFVTNSSAPLFGTWSGTGGSLTVRGPLPLHMNDSPGCRVVGTTSSPCLLQAGTLATSIAVAATRCDGTTIGPNVGIDGRQTAATALQVANSAAATVRNVAIGGHTGFGLTAVASPSLLVRDCTIDGGTGVPAANGVGLLVNPGCHATQLWGNLVRRQQQGAFAVVDSDDVLVGPGNRAIDNGGDGFLVTDSGTGPATRRATLQSVVAIGRSNAAQSGFRCVHVRPTFTNVTATRNGTGVLLQLGSTATVVNSISWGNTVDRNRDPTSSGSWLHGMRGSSAGNGTPGTWTDQNTLVNFDPLFVSAATGDVRLGAGSPAIDSGLHATPTGAGLPCADAGGDLRIRGGTIDRGAHEFVPVGGTGNSLDVAGLWLRSAAQAQLDFTLRAGPAHAGQMWLLVMSGSGTGPGLAGPGGTLLPIVPDAFTGVLIAAPTLSSGVLDGAGQATTTLQVPGWVTPLLPALTFVAMFTSVAAATNPVVVRYLP